jgi:type-F conjugative transfer system pilin assembly protein TrbC
MAKAEGGPGAGSGFRPFSGAASDQQRDAYRQSVNAASSQFTERFARSATDEKVAAGLARPGQEDRLQELLRQQQAAQQTRERRNNSGTAAVPEDALLVFVSFSMPDHVLRALSDQARAVGATLILRGMVNGRLSATQEAALKVNGAGAGWEINPELFTTFDVQTVPAFVLTGNKRVLDEGCAPDDEGMCSNANTFSKVSGNISIDIALDTMRRRTDIPLIRDLAERRLDSLAKARGKGHASHEIDCSGPHRIHFAWGHGVHAQPLARTPLQMLDIELIAKAIRSMSGRAEGEVQGVHCAALKDMTGSQEPLHSTVTVLKRFRQFECARVQIDVTQEKVPSKFGTFHTFHMPPLGLNICTDGNPPDGRLEKLPEGNFKILPEMLPR